MKKRNWVFFLFYFFYEAGIVLPGTYQNVYFERVLGFTGTQLGMFSGISILLSAVLIPVWGMTGDRTGRYKGLLIGFFASWLFLIFLLSRQSLFLAALLVGILIEAARCGCNPIADTITVDHMARSGGNFSTLRAGGSIGAMLSAMICGILAKAFGLEKVFFPGYMMMIGAALLMVLLLPRVKRQTLRKEEKRGDLKSLLHNRRFLFLMAVTLLSTILPDGINTYTGNHLITTLHGNEVMVSINSICQMLPEFFLMLIFGVRVLPKIGFRKAYLLAAMTQMFRFAVWFLAQHPYVFMIGTLTHMFTFACLSTGNVMFLRHIVSTENFATAATLMFSVNTLGRAAYGYLGGIVYQYLGSRWIYLFAFLLVTAVMIVELRTSFLDIPYRDPSMEETA